MTEIKEGNLYYTDQGYVVVAEKIYMSELEHRERVLFKHLMDPDKQYDCYLYRAQEIWISMEVWHKAKAKWEIR